MESSYKMGDSLNGVKGLDIEEEQAIVADKLKQLKENGATEEFVTQTMKDLGLER